MAKPLKIVIAGCSGRMGHALLESVFADSELQLHGALDRTNNPQIGRNAGELFAKNVAINITDNADEALRDADILVDFTRPEASMQYLAACEKHQVKMVIGTTGFSVEK
jgi:4-hydroxy-tetrahydrodipicolinate reductase